MASELSFHIERYTEDLVRSGVPIEEARRRAGAEFGAVEARKEECREAIGLQLLDELRADVRYALRMFRRNPGFAAVAVLTLALGIGANTAMFTILNAVLLKPLPFHAAHQLVHITWIYGEARDSLTIPQFQFIEEHNRVFDSLAGTRWAFETRLDLGSSHQWARALTVTQAFFRTLGVHPALGRDFLPEEDRPGGPAAMVLTDSLWRRGFGADPAIIGKLVVSQDRSYAVVGVLPAWFEYVQPVDAFVTLQPGNSIADQGMNTEVIARVKSDVSFPQAQANLNSIFRGYRPLHPEEHERGIGFVPYQQYLAGDIRPSLLLLFGAVGLLLVIACADLAGLILARATARQGESSIRLALGASRERLFAQFLTESLLISLAGAVAGWCGAYWLLRALAASMPFDLPSTAHLRPDLRVLIFTLAVAVGTGLLFSLLPLARLIRLDVNEVIKQGGTRSGAGREHARAQRVLIVAETAISVALLVGTGLLMESLYRMHQEKLGFKPQGIMTMRISVGKAHRQSGAARWDFERSLLAQLEAVPGVVSAARVDMLPLSGPFNLPTEHVGKPADSIGGMEYRAITPRYFETLGIPILQGRGIQDSDARSGPQVALISESVARQWFPNGNAIGERLQVGRYQGQEFPEVEEPPREIVGVVGDVKAYGYLMVPAPPTVYVPAAQEGEGIARGNDRTDWVIRAKATAGLGEALRAALAQVDPEERVLKIRPMADVVAESVARPRFDSLLMAAFAALAVMLAGIGIFGVLSYQLSRRTHEIGVRMALGAERGEVQRLFVRQGLTLAAAGAGLGLIGAWMLSRFLQSMLFGVQAHEPRAFLAAAVIMMAVAFFASYLPARRASRVDPMVALRYE